jgi:predicted nuclease of predicted toxin-antitoxin system
VRFIIDEQLPRRLGRWLQAQGHLAVHVLDQDFGGDDDRQIVSYAIARELIVITKDADFPALQRNEQPRIVWLRCGNMINRALIALFERNWSDAEAKLSRGDCLIELY